MNWYAELKKDKSVEGIQHGARYEYRTTKDYDQQFSVFNGQKWIVADVEKFELKYAPRDCQT